MINRGEGIPLPPLLKKKKKGGDDDPSVMQRQLRLLKEMKDFGEAIRMNLLAKSGLKGDRVLRDLNILESGIREAAYHLDADELRPALDRHFGLDNLKKSDLNKQADGCTIAALLMMNAAMLHQRIANGRWLPGVSDLESVKNDVNVARRVSREWNQILRHDFKPILEPAVQAIEAIEDTGKLAGLERALRHIAAEAERIAETYADMGADHAGPLFNRVMGNQASDGAYFTRPVAASIAARLTLDACGDVDWSDAQAWRDHKIVDLGTLCTSPWHSIIARKQHMARSWVMEQPTFADLEYAQKKRKTRREKFLERMDALLPWAEMEARIAPYYPKAGRGRRPYPLSVMLRVHCVQLFYNLSDPGMEDMLYEVEPVRRFVGLRLSEALPDETTILHFRTLAGEAPVGRGVVGGDQRAFGRSGLAAASGDGSGRDHHRGADIDEEPRGGARPGDAAGEEGEPVLLWDEAAHRGRRGDGGSAQLHHHVGERARRDASGSVAARRRAAGVGRRRVRGGAEAAGASGTRRDLECGAEAWAAAETGA